MCFYNKLIGKTKDYWCPAHEAETAGSERDRQAPSQHSDPDPQREPPG